MAMEQSLYAQVIMFRQKDLKFGMKKQINEIMEAEMKEMDEKLEKKHFLRRW